ncbi:MAG: hypothetical protein QXY18_03370 [Nitrososphaerota archaeon]
MSKKDKLEYIRRYMRERYHKDIEFREKMRSLLRKSARKRCELVRKLRKEYPEYDKIIAEYIRNKNIIGYKKAYKILKKKIDKLRKEKSMYFPYTY